MSAASEKAQTVEAQLQKLHQLQDLEAVATTLLSAHGPEILGFLKGMVSDEAEAREIYGRFTLDLWTGLAGFEGRCTYRTWAYTVARNAAHRHRADPYAKKKRRLSAAPEPQQGRRTTTAWHRRSDVKSKVRMLRDRLSADDRALLILRIDRGMPWNDVARVLFGAEYSASKTASLRKRYERVVQRLRRYAQEEGLLANQDAA